MRKDDKVVAIRKLRNGEGQEARPGRRGKVLATDDGYAVRFEAEGFFGVNEPVFTGLTDSDIAQI